MTGSVFDGEDVVQEALMHAFRVLRSETEIVDLERWIFKIAHNAAIDFLRKRARESPLAEYDPETLALTDDENDHIETVPMSMRMLMRLPANQRAAVLLKDVLGYRLQDVTSILEMSLPAVKTALHRGRSQLRDLAQRDIKPTWAPKMSPAQRALFERYVDLFNAHDFEAIRETLAEEVRLDLVGVERREGKLNVGHYFENYSKRSYWRLRVGTLEGRYVVMVHSAEVGSPALYFVELEWEGDKVRSIRDFGHARYALANAEVEESFSEAPSSVDA
jgi:RNA polymerase sigma-70 factor (ECF subfamily)